MDSACDTDAQKPKEIWFGVLTQYGMPDSVARPFVDEAQSLGQLIDRLDNLLSSPTDLLRLLATHLKIPSNKRPWLDVLLKHGMPQGKAKLLLRNIVGGAPELSVKLREIVSGQEADMLMAEVCGARAERGSISS